MSIQFNPQSITPASAADPSLPLALPPAALSMAPVELTPLAPPSPAPRSAPRHGAGNDPAADARRAAFAERQQALLERLRPGGATPPAGQTGGLPEAQRNACLSVLAAVASAAAQ